MWEYWFWLLSGKSIFSWLNFLSNSENSFCSNNDESSDVNYECENIVQWTRTKFNEIVKGLNLSKTSSLKLLTQLKANNLTQCDVTFRSIRNRNERLMEFFTDVNNMCYCNDIQGLISALHGSYFDEDWILFIDG